MTDENKDDVEPETTDSSSVDDSTQAADGETTPSAGQGAASDAEDAEADGTELSEDDIAPDDPSDTALSDADEELLDKAAADLVAEMRSDMLRAQAELVNFRQRVQRDRQANRDAVIAEVVRALLPALDDLSRAEQHGDLDGGPLELVAQKIRNGFDRFGLKTIGRKGEAFDPNIHEAIVQIPSADATEQTVADVIEAGYRLGDRVLRAAKVAVSVPE